MVCLRFERAAARWKAQTKPRSYGGHPRENIYFPLALLFIYLDVYVCWKSFNLKVSSIETYLHMCQTVFRWCHLDVKGKYFLKWAIHGLFFFMFVFFCNQLTVNTFSRSCRWLDSNPGPLLSERNVYVFHLSAATWWPNYSNNYSTL